MSDYNKIVASVEYFMWTQNINITDIRIMDVIIREIMNNNHAKYKLQLNSLLHLPREKGGRGLRNLGSTYKCTRIKTAIKIIVDTGPRMKLVKRFDLLRLKKKRKSIVNDAIRYSEDEFDAKFEVKNDVVNFEYKKDDEMIITSDYGIVAKYLKEKQVKINEENMIKSKWQGLLLKERLDDKNINMKECFRWNFKWKTSGSN